MNNRFARYEDTEHARGKYKDAKGGEDGDIKSKIKKIGGRGGERKIKIKSEFVRKSKRQSKEI